MPFYNWHFKPSTSCMCLLRMARTSICSFYVHSVLYANQCTYSNYSLRMLHIQWVLSGTQNRDVMHRCNKECYAKRRYVYYSCVVSVVCCVLVMLDILWVWVTNKVHHLQKPKTLKIS